MNSVASSSNTIKRVDYDPSLLTYDDVKKYICPTASEKEVTMFINLCKYQGLNPFLREAYLIKYGNKDATMVVGKDTFLKRARSHPDYCKHEAWVEGNGSDMIGIANVYYYDSRGNKNHITVKVHFDEYSNPQSPLWRSKPKTMLRKVALVHAFRETFPDYFSGLYDQIEMDSIKDELPLEPIKPDVNIVKHEFCSDEEVNLKQEDINHHDVVMSASDVVNAIRSCGSINELKSLFMKSFSQWKSAFAEDDINNIVKEKDIAKEKLEAENDI